MNRAPFTLVDSRGRSGQSAGASERSEVDHREPGQDGSHGFEEARGTRLGGTAAASGACRGGTGAGGTRVGQWAAAIAEQASGADQYHPRLCVSRINSCFMPHDTRGGIIMNSVVAILCFVVVIGSILPDVSSAHNHAVNQERQGTRSLMLAESDDYIGPVLRGKDLSRREMKSSWISVGLTPTDPHHLVGNESPHPVAYRNSQMADGGAIMFSWPLGSLSTFEMRTEAPPRESNLNRENAWADPRPW